MLSTCVRMHTQKPPKHTTHMRARMRTAMMKNSSMCTHAHHIRSSLSLSLADNAGGHNERARTAAYMWRPQGLVPESIGSQSRSRRCRCSGSFMRSNRCDALKEQCESMCAHARAHGQHKRRAFDCTHGRQSPHRRPATTTSARARRRQPPPSNWNNALSLGPRCPFTSECACIFHVTIFCFCFGLLGFRHAHRHRKPVRSVAHYGVETLFVRRQHAGWQALAGWQRTCVNIIRY